MSDLTIKNIRQQERIMRSNHSISNPQNTNNTSFKANESDEFINNSKTNKTDKIDKSNDGKFSLKEAGKNFLKGIVSPVTAMFKSPKSFITGVAIIAGSAAIIVATGGAAAPLFVAAGIAMGTVQAGKGIHKIITAENGDDVEKAFHDMGAATSTIGLSVAGAKTSLKQAALPTKGMNSIQATGKCFSTMKTSTSRSYNMFKSGNYKAGFKHKKIIKEYDNYAEKIAKETATKQKDAFNEIKSFIPDEYKSKLSSRAKSKSSIYDKIMFYIRKDKKIKSVEDAKLYVEDLVGTRLILDETSPATMNKIVNSLTSTIEQKKITVTVIENYRGPNGKPYFSDLHIERLQKASKKAGQKDFKVVSGESALKEGGYTTTQMDIVHHNGIKGEFQIRGKHINEFAEVEHLPYDLRQNKDLSKGSSLMKNLLKPLKKEAQNLKNNKAHLDSYNNYLKSLYEYSRDLELGIPTQKPYFPKELKNVLNVESLNKIHQITKNYSRNKYSEAIAISPFYAGTTNFFENN